MLATITSATSHQALVTHVQANRTIIDTPSLVWFVRDDRLATPLRAQMVPKHVRYTLLPEVIRA